MKIKNSIFPPQYTRYGKNVRKQICLFQKDPHFIPYANVVLMDIE